MEPRPAHRLACAVSLVAALAAPDARAGVRGDSGWSADGSAWGFCDPWMLPDAEGGCRFFDRDERIWVELGRREALELWRPWEQALEPSGTRPMWAVYPMEQDEENPGPVTLSVRLVPSDEVVEIWSLEGDVVVGDRGGEWRTVFDYSQDGLWLAVGAAHVDHETSANEVSVTVRPVREWQALALTRLALDALARGRIEAGIRKLARARELASEDAPRQAAAPEEADDPLDLSRWVDLDEVHERALARWSTDGRTFCACDSWREASGLEKARCSTYRPGEGDEAAWTPVVVSLVDTHCPGYGRAPEAKRAPPPLRFWADGGFDGETGAVVLYVTGGPLGSRLAAIREDRWEEPTRERDHYPAWFHPLGMASPDGRWFAAGWLEERTGDEYRLEWDIRIEKVTGWLEIAEAERSLYDRTEPVQLEDARPPLELPGGDGGGGTGEDDPGPAPEDEAGGCSCGAVPW